MKKLPTVSIGIPAYNEEKNIANILNSLMHQKRNAFFLKRITVYSDGSNDKTCEIVKKFHKDFPVIHLVRAKERRGKMFRLNQIFHNCNSDILVTLDADIGISGKNFLDKLSSDLIADPKAKMVAAHQIPLKPQNFFGKVVYTSFSMWDYIRLNMPSCDHVQNFYGAATAYRGSFARELHIPEGLSEERLYIYLMAKKSQGFRYCREAEIVYWPVSTWYDLTRIANRVFGKTQVKLDKFFEFDTSKYYVIPWRYKLIGLVKSFLHDPFYSPLALLLNLFLGRLRPKKMIIDTPLWEISLSTRKAIKI